MWLGRWLATGLGLVALGACGGGKDGGGEASADPAPATTPDPTSTAADGPWRFRPTLDRNLPEGAVAEPVMELSQPRQRSVVLVAAVIRADAGPITLERWTYAQTPDGEDLELDAKGAEVLRVRAGPRHPELEQLRRELAAPRVVLTRPVGLAAQPEQTLAQLGAAVRTMQDVRAPSRERVKATAAVVRGLDDAIVLERDAIHEVIDLLADPFTVQTQSQSDRRSTATVQRGDRVVATLGMQRKADGWAVVSIDTPPDDDTEDDAPPDADGKGVAAEPDGDGGAAEPG